MEDITTMPASVAATKHQKAGEKISETAFPSRVLMTTSGMHDLQGFLQYMSCKVRKPHPYTYPQGQKAVC